MLNKRGLLGLLGWIVILVIVIAIVAGGTFSLYVGKDGSVEIGAGSVSLNIEGDQEKSEANENSDNTQEADEEISILDRSPQNSSEDNTQEADEEIEIEE